jgi:hypothetical protein
MAGNDRIADLLACHVKRAWNGVWGKTLPLALNIIEADKVESLQ